MEKSTTLSALLPREPFCSPPEGAEDIVVPLAGGTLTVRQYLTETVGPHLFFFPAEKDSPDHYHDLGQNLNKEGVSLSIIAYRGQNAGEGEATWGNIFDDALAAFDFLLRYLEERGRYSPIALLGRSLGAGIALRIAVERASKVWALVLDSPIIDGRAWLSYRGLASEEDPFQIEKYIKKWTKPLLIFQAQLDEEVSLPQAEKLLIFCPGRNKKLLIMPGYHREETIERGGLLYAETIAELLNRLVGRFKKKDFTKGRSYEP